MESKSPITSSELGTLWMTYQKNKMMFMMMEYFIEKAEDNESKNILITYHKEISKFSNEIEQIFYNEGSVIPLAFGDNDVHKDAPPLFDDVFAIMFLRLMMKIALGFNALHLGMSYRKDIRDFYNRSLVNSQDIYNKCSDYLSEKGILVRPPYVSMPKEVEFVEDKSYMKGIKLFGDKRALNTVEVAHIYQAIESNIIGMQLITGYAQIAKESEVKDYFITGKELAKKIITNLSDILLQSDIQPPSTWAGRATDSIITPFTDKIMMFSASLLSSYALGSYALGTSFSLRSDLPLVLLTIMKDTHDYASEGGQLMIKHKWLEEPPQMEDRNQLTKSKQ